MVAAPAQAAELDQPSEEVPSVEFNSDTQKLDFPEVEEVKDADPVGYEQGFEVLQSSTEIREFISQMTPNDVEGTLEVLAAYAPSVEQAQNIVAAFDGNKMIWDGSDYKLVSKDAPGSLAKNPNLRGVAMPTCAKA